MAVFCRGDADSNNVPEMRLTCAAAYLEFRRFGSYTAKKAAAGVGV